MNRHTRLPCSRPRLKERRRRGRRRGGLPHLRLSALGHVPTLRLGQSGLPELAAAWKTSSGRKEQ
jgi:hypothetical protein